MRNDPCRGNPHCMYFVTHMEHGVLRWEDVGVSDIYIREKL